MYPLQMNGQGLGTKDAALRAYARMEYPHEDVLWLLAQARQAREVSAPRGSLVRRVTRGLRTAGERVVRRIVEKDTALPL